MENVRPKLAEGIHTLMGRLSPLRGDVVLFGSRARGDFREDSDWDLLVLLDKDRIEPSDYDTVTYPMRELGWELDAEVNPILYTRQSWEARRHTPFFKNVMAEGVPL